MVTNSLPSHLADGLCGEALLLLKRIHRKGELARLVPLVWLLPEHLLSVLLAVVVDALWDSRSGHVTMTSSREEKEEREKVKKREKTSFL